MVTAYIFPPPLLKNGTAGHQIDGHRLYVSVIHVSEKERLKYKIVLY